MSASISALPIWKKGSTPAEWFGELASMAMEHPERFARVVVIYEEVNEQRCPVFTRQQSYGIENNTDILGTLECGKLELFEYMKGRRT